MANIELPKDADGREIPLDTVALYDDNGNVHNIRRFMYTNDSDPSDKWMNSWIAVVDDYKTAKPEQMHLTQPDSWEKLEEEGAMTDKAKSRYVLNKKALQHYLIDHDLTQADFAKRLSISTSYFNELMNGRKSISISNMFSIAEETHMDIRVFLEKVDE